MEILTMLAQIWLWMMAAFFLVVILDILLRGRLSEILLSPLIERSSKKRE